MVHGRPSSWHGSPIYKCVCRPRISVPGKISTMHLVEVVTVVVAVIPEAAEENGRIKS